MPSSFKVKAAARKDGTLVARKLEAYSNQGGYASHAHAIVANSSNEFKQIYKDEKVLSRCLTVYTNLATGGAMRIAEFPRPRCRGMHGRRPGPGPSHGPVGIQERTA